MVAHLNEKINNSHHQGALTMWISVLVITERSARCMILCFVFLNKLDHACSGQWFAAEIEIVQVKKHPYFHHGWLMGEGRGVVKGSMELHWGEGCKPKK